MPGRPLGEARREKPQKRRQADEGVVTRTRPGDECAVRGAQISCGGRRRLRRRRRPRRPGYGARRLRGAQALRLGPSFKGMGDFAVEAEALRRALDGTVRAHLVADPDAGMRGAA